MTSPARQLIAIRYHRDRHWDAEYTAAPDWQDVVAAIRRMDDHFYPIVQLNCAERADDETIFNVVSGEVRLWASDQGYFCASATFSLTSTRY